MQVSWIDPEEIQAFLAQIEGPKKAPAQVAWEIHTLPVQPLPTATAPSMFGSPEITPPATPSPPPPPPEMPLSDQRRGPEGGEIWSIREQLRSLRERAVVSGIVPAGLVMPTEPESPRLVVPPAQEPAPRPPGPAPERESDWEAAPPPAPLSPEAREAMDELLGPSGPLPESPPQSDPATLPKPMQPPTSPLPPSIEYSGPAPSVVISEPLFGTSKTSSSSTETPPATFPPAAPAPANALESAFEDALQALEPVALAAVDEPTLIEQAPHPDAPASPFSLATDFTPPALGLSDRLHALATWAIERLGTREVLLVDDYGDVLWGGHEHTSLVLAAMMAWQSAQRTSAESVCADPERIDREISPGRHLTVIPMRTRYGTVSLAAICTAQLTEGDTQAVRQALMSAVEGQ